jgi:hypothetical protein
VKPSWLVNAWVRLAAASLLTALPISTAVAKDSAAADSLMADSSAVAPEGRVIRAIEIKTYEIFETEPGTLGAPVLGIANRLHIRTRAATVRSHLLFREGERWDPAVGEETARNLRRLQFLVPERIEPVIDGDSLKVVVATRDLWSTLVDFNLERGGGQTYGAFSFTERNLIGLGKELSLGYNEDPTGVSRSLFVHDPAVGGSRVRFRAGGATGSDGASNEFSIGVPFYALDTPVAYVAEGTRITSVAHLFERGSEVANFDRRIERLELTAGVGSRRGEVVRRMTGSFLMFNRRLGATTLAPGAPADFAGEEDNLRIRRFSGTLSLWRPDFINRTFVDEMGPVEDFDVGQRVLIELGLSPAFLGGTQDEAYVRFGIDAGTRNALGFGSVRISTESRVRSVPTEIIRRLNARWTSQWGGHHTTVLSVVGIEGSRVPRDFQVVFGGLNGLRAYSVHALSGRRAWRFNAEDRWTVPRDFGRQLRVGLAGFYDGARAWGPGSGGSGWFHSAGTGLRMSLPRLAPSQVIRIDVAWPILPSRDGRRDPVVSFGSRLAF